jgi:hypothetical protein
VGETTELEIARREFETEDGVVMLSIVTEESEAPAMTYRFSRESGEVFETLTVYGADSTQALLFCLTAAGDYLRARIPSASFARTGSTGLPVTDLTARGEWLARISMPEGEPTSPDGERPSPP